MIRCGLDALLDDLDRLRGRRYGLLAHAASVTAELRPAAMALVKAGVPPLRLFAPEHGFHGVEQDMVPADGTRDPLTDLPIQSLYRESATSLRPDAAAFDGLDLLLVDLQDVGCRYYTYAATAVWAAEVARTAGCDIWVLDRPNPLGGRTVEGNMRQPGFESFVGAFELPVRHGLTLGELVRLESARRGWGAELEVIPLAGWSREMRWEDSGRPWIAPSPNLPTPEAAAVYPGSCLIEATELSEGRGTTRPFLLTGAPGLDAVALARRLNDGRLRGVHYLPAFFRPQFQKHSGQICGGVRWIVTDPELFSPYRAGVELLRVLRQEVFPAFSWRREPYEFETERPAIDLLSGDSALRTALDAGGDLRPWLESWEADEREFRRQRRAILLYPEDAE